MSTLLPTSSDWYAAIDDMSRARQPNENPDGSPLEAAPATPEAKTAGRAVKRQESGVSPPSP